MPHRDDHAATTRVGGVGVVVIVAAIGLLVVPVAVSCAKFGVGEGGPEIASDDAAKTNDGNSGDPVLSPEPAKGSNGIVDASTYDGPPIDGGTIPDSPRCASDAGPLMIGLQLGTATYCIDATEVTVAQYTVFLNAIGAGFVPDKPQYCAFNTNYAPNCGGNNTTAGDAPINCIDWCDAWAFCKWSGKRLCGRIGGGANGQADLSNPTKSQWFAACSHGGARTYAYGSQSNAVCNASPNPPAAVKSHLQCEGGFDGLFDLTGNVGEWEDSCSDTTGETDQCLRRGGDIDDDPAAQTCDQIYAIDRKSRYEAGGFRCCKD